MTGDAPVPPDGQIDRIRRYQDILANFSRMAPQASDTDRLLQLASLQAARGIDIGHAKVLRYRPETGDLLMVAGVGWKPGVVGRVALGTDLASPPGRSFQTRQTVAIDDLPNNPEFRYSAVLRDHGIASVLNAPVAIDGVTWGVIEVDSATPRHFGTDDAQFLSALGNILGLALHGRAESQRVADAEARSALALAQERTLLEELRHRSKNDLQLILSMLVLQKRKQTDEQARRSFDHLMDRVTAVGMAHDQLAPGAGAVELADYLKALCGNLNQRRDNVRIDTKLTPATMPHERAVSLGLIVNELVTNALKYAFPNERDGVIEVVFEAEPHGEGYLRVRDNGVGLGPPRPGSSGTELVQRLARQLGGRMEHDPAECGTSFSLVFPLVI